MIGPDATVTLDFALARLTGVVDKLLIYPQNMRKNLDKLGGLHNSQRVLLADPGRRQPRGQLRHGPAKRDADLGA